MTGYRVLLGVAAALLVATAGLHATGLATVSDELALAELAAEWQAIFRGLWLMFSIHLVIVAGLLAVLAVRPAHRAVLLVAAAVPIADTMLLLSVVGLFVGPVLTGSATVLCLVAARLLPAEAATG